EHEHVGPHIRLAFERSEAGTRAKITVLALGFENGSDPFPGFGDDFFILQHVAEIAIALEPGWQFFPPAVPFTFWLDPGVAFVDAPLRKLGKMANHSVALQLELMPQPALRSDRADGEFDQGAGAEGRAVGDVLRWRTG